MELVDQMGHIGTAAKGASRSALQIDRIVAESMMKDSFPTSHFGVPLAASAIPAGEVATLAHELRDDAVERRPLVVELLLGLAWRWAEERLENGFISRGNTFSDPEPSNLEEPSMPYLASMSRVLPAP